jgi:hypothetical protein
VTETSAGLQIHIFGSHSYGSPAHIRPQGGAYAIVAQRGTTQHEHWGLGFEANAPALVAHAMVRLIRFIQLRVDDTETVSRQLNIVTESATTVAMRMMAAVRDKAKLDSLKMKGKHAGPAKPKDRADLWLELGQHSDLFKLGDRRAALNIELLNAASRIAKDRANQAVREGRNRAGINLTDTMSLDWLLADLH